MRSVIRVVLAKVVSVKPLPAGSCASTGPPETTVQPVGATTEKENRALRSGCSKQAYIRRASADSNWL